MADLKYARPYWFPPMMPTFVRIVMSKTDYLMSTDGRRFIAQHVRSCRRVHGRDQARAFLNALHVAGCVFPIVRK